MLTKALPIFHHITVFKVKFYHETAIKNNFTCNESRQNMSMATPSHRRSQNTAARIYFCQEIVPVYINDHPEFHSQEPQRFEKVLTDGFMGFTLSPVDLVSPSVQG